MGRMRPDTKIIEAKWHKTEPIMHNGLEICHEHRRSDIIFTAWKDDNPANSRQVINTRHQVAYMNLPDVDDLNWLTEEGVE